MINKTLTKKSKRSRLKDKLIKPDNKRSNNDGGDDDGGDDKKSSKPSFVKNKNKQRPSSVPPKRRRKDWWNKLHDDADRLQNKIIRQQKMAKALKRREEIEGCTFKPEISEPAKTLKRDGSKIWKRIVDPMGKNKGSRLQQLRKRKKMKDKEKYKKECTFKPFISDKSHQIMENKKLDSITEINENYQSNIIYDNNNNNNNNNNDKKGNVFNRLHLSPKTRKISIHKCCSPKVQKKSRSKSKTKTKIKSASNRPRYVTLHELSYKYNKRAMINKFHPDEDITFQPRILNDSHVPIFRKSVINVCDHLYNAHTSSSTKHKKSTISDIKNLNNNNKTIIKVSNETENILKRYINKKVIVYIINYPETKIMN